MWGTSWRQRAKTCKGFELWRSPKNLNQQSDYKNEFLNDLYHLVVFDNTNMDLTSVILVLALRFIPSTYFSTGLAAKWSHGYQVHLPSTNFTLICDCMAALHCPRTNTKILVIFLFMFALRNTYCFISSLWISRSASSAAGASAFGLFLSLCVF